MFILFNAFIIINQYPTHKSIPHSFLDIDTLHISRGFVTTVAKRTGPEVRIKSPVYTSGIGARQQLSGLNQIHPTKAIGQKP